MQVNKTPVCQSSCCSDCRQYCFRLSEAPNMLRDMRLWTAYIMWFPQISSNALWCLKVLKPLTWCIHSLVPLGLQPLPIHHQACLCRFSKVKYTLQAVHTSSQATPAASTADSLQQVEAQLLKKKTELQTFGTEFRQASTLYCQSPAETQLCFCLLCCFWDAVQGHCMQKS